MRLLIFVLLGLASRSAYAEEFSVLGHTIFYSNSAVVEYSDSPAEQVISNPAGETIRLNVRDHFVFRGDSEKVSFTPLKSTSLGLEEIGLRAQYVSGFQLPDTYQSISTLFQRFYMQGSKSSKICEVFILNNLLDGAHQKRLRRVLIKQGVNFEEHNGYMVAECLLAQGGESNGL